MHRAPELCCQKLADTKQADPSLTYNQLTLAEAQALIPAIDLKAFLGGPGVTSPGTVQVPDFAGMRGAESFRPVAGRRPAQALALACADGLDPCAIVLRTGSDAVLRRLVADVGVQSPLGRLW